MEKNNEAFEALIQTEISKDTEFQNSLTDLPEDEKTNLITAKRQELIAQKAPKWFEEATNYKIRAEKAEGKKEEKPPVVTNKEEVSGDELTVKDAMVLMGAKIPQEDIETVTDFAKFKKIPIGEAINSPILKQILADNLATRTTANATQTRTTRQTVKLDGNAVIDNAKNKGEEGIPEPGSPEAMAMFLARKGRIAMP